MSDEHRYLFTVRQRFGEVPTVDSFYEVQVPPGLTGEQAQIMTRLSEEFCKSEINADSQALRGMNLRLRFNSDMFQRVCLVRSEAELTAEDLDVIVEMKASEGTLLEFLEESSLNS